MSETFMTLSDYFDSFVAKASEGVAKTNKKIQKGYYQDEDGNEAVIFRSFNDDGSLKHCSYFINGKPVKGISQEVIDAMEFADTEGVVEATTVPETLPAPLVKGSPELQFDMAISDNELIIDADVRGVPPENVKVTFSGVYLSIEVASKAAANEALYVVKSLKNLENCKKQIYIDESRFSIRDLNYEVVNGTLSIRIPKNDAEANVLVFKPRTGKATRAGKSQHNKNETTETSEDSAGIPEEV